MLILSDYIAPETRVWHACNAYTTNSTVLELLTRIVLYGSDLHTLTEIHSNAPDRAMEIASSRSFLSTLIGGNTELLPAEPLNGAMFLHQQQTIIPRWRHVSETFRKMNFGLKELKYAPDKQDPHYRRSNYPEDPSTLINKAGEVLVLGDYQMQLKYTAMPTLAVLYPMLRYVPSYF